MKIRHIPTDKDKSAVQLVLEAIPDFPDLKELLGDTLEAAHKEAGRATETWKTHAGDLEAGEIGIDAEDKFYLGCEGSGAYELDGKTRWMSHAGPSVKLVDFDEIVFLGKGKGLDKPEEKPDYEDKGSQPLLEHSDGLLEAVERLLEAIQGRFKENGASILEDAAKAVRKLL